MWEHVGWTSDGSCRTPTEWLYHSTKSILKLNIQWTLHFTLKIVNDTLNLLLRIKLMWRHLCVKWPLLWRLHMWETHSLTPKLFGGGRCGQGQPPVQENPYFLDLTENYCLPTRLRKNHCPCILEATYPQIPYWVHFTFKVQNPIYMFSWLSK